MSKHRRLETLTLIKEIGLVPIFYQADAEVAERLVEACADGGARIVEFTNRGDGALDVFARLARWCAANRPETVLGAGTILDAPTAAMYLAAGASFIVAPNLDADVARLCNGRKIPYLPGCASVSEIQQAHVLGVEICKLFPAAEVGGPAFVKNLRGPLPWAEIMPAGGVAPTRESLASWFDVGVACVGMGSGLFAPELLAKRDYAGIVARIENVIALIRDVRRAG